MRRREFLAQSAKAAVATALAPALRAWPQTAPSAPAQAAAIPATLTVKPQNQIAAIPPDFAGLSYESAQLANPAFFSARNSDLVAFFQTLGKQGVLRIGGNTSEFTRWSKHETSSAAPVTANPDTNGKNAKPSTTVTPEAIRNLEGFLEATGWKLIYGLNLGTGSTKQASEEAAFVADTMGPRLIAFQIGNEPDLYNRNGLRPQNWTFDDYLSQWRDYAAAVRHRVRGARFGAPDVASKTDWVVSFAKEAGKETAFLSRHYYAEGPPTNPAMTISRLLQPNAKFDDSVAVIQQLSRATGLPFRLTETNSCYDGGKAGVSDTFASALWGGDMMFQIAQAAEIGANFHGGGNGIYTPIAGSLDEGFTARPLYYGLLLFAQAAAATLVENAFDAGGANATAYSVRLATSGVGVSLFNKDESKALRVRVMPGIRVNTAEILRLVAPSLDAKSGVGFGGALVTGSGAWSPSDTETPEYTDAAVTVDLPPASAVWLRVE